MDAILDDIASRYADALFYLCSRKDSLLFSYVKPAGRRWMLLYSAPPQIGKDSCQAYEILMGVAKRGDYSVCSSEEVYHWSEIEIADCGEEYNAEFALLGGILELQHVLLSITTSEYYAQDIDGTDLSWPQEDVPSAEEVDLSAGFKKSVMFGHGGPTSRTKPNLMNKLSYVGDKFIEDVAAVNSDIVNISYDPPSVLFHMCMVGEVMIFTFARNTKCKPGLWVNVYPDIKIMLEYKPYCDLLSSYPYKKKMKVIRGRIDENARVKVHGVWDVDNWYDAVTDLPHVSGRSDIDKNKSVSYGKASEEDMVYYDIMDNDLVTQLV